MRSRDKHVDVAVIGASLAGCATAALLARAGLRVALVDKHAGEDAYKRLCGHYIQASATPVIERLGLAGAVEAAGGVRNGVDLWTRWGLIASPEPPHERPYGYSIRRARLDPMIRRLANDTPGVEYLPRLELVGLLGGDAVDGVELRDRARRSLRVRARLVVGADGRTSAVARLAGARERRSPNERFCYMAYFNGVGLPPGSGGRFWALDPDVAIAAPNDDDMTILAAFLHKRRLPEFRGDRAAALRKLFAGLPEPPALEGAELAGKVVGYTDYGLVMRDPTPRPGLALVGDAGLTSDPVMAIGCGWALQSAAWLADSAAPALAGVEDLSSALRRYRRLRRRQLAPHHRMLAADARARPMNPVQRMLFSAATRDPQTAALFHRYAERSIPPRRLLSPRTLGRAARVSAPSFLHAGHIVATRARPSGESMPGRDAMDRRHDRGAGGLRGRGRRLERG
jgi:2-polyprenyl-6-methoxyphenol hydroxylase-like FAD-dependent oxidoreductase